MRLTPLNRADQGNVRCTVCYLDTDEDLDQDSDPFFTISVPPQQTTLHRTARIRYHQYREASP